MAKKISLSRPIESLEIDFVDKVIVFKFDMYAIDTIQREFDDISKLAEDYKDRPFELMAIVLYCGSKKNSDLTIEEAQVIVSESAEVYFEVNRLLYDSLSILCGGEFEKKLRAIMESQVKEALI